MGPTLIRAKHHGPAQVRPFEIGRIKVGTYLSGANLQGANLSGAAMSGASLQKAFLVGANLHGASLGGAELQRVDFRAANLTDVDFSAVGSIAGADFSGTVGLTAAGRSHLLRHPATELDEWNAFTRKTTRQSLESDA